MKKAISLMVMMVVLAGNTFASAGEGQEIKYLSDPVQPDATIIYGKLVGLEQDATGKIVGVVCQGGPPDICFRITTVGPRLEVDLGNGDIFEVRDYEEEIRDDESSYFRFRR